MNTSVKQPELILIGSRAIAYSDPAFKLKPNTDWDIISEEPLERDLDFYMKSYEWHDRNFLNNAKFDAYCISTAFEVNEKRLYALNLRGLSIIKRSHLWRDLDFDKHITHYHKYLIPKHLWLKSDVAIYQERLALTKAAFPQRQPNLMQSKEDFFDDAVKKVYEHDYLHELVAFYEKPLYTRLLRSPELAWCDEDKWNSLTELEKVQCVAEETMVIAIERFLVPGDWQMPPKLAFMKALRKVCTTLCSGWFRDYAIDSYPQVVQAFDKNVFDRVKFQLNKESKGD